MQKILSLSNVLFYLFIATVCHKNIATEVDKEIASNTNLRSQTNSELAIKPTMYYFSSPGCPACYEMDPVINGVKTHYKDKLDVVTFNKTTKERIKLLRKYNQHVDVRYVPFIVLADSNGRVLAYSKGYTPQEILHKHIDDGLEKFQRLSSLKISSLLFVCHYAYDVCPQLEKELSDWIDINKTRKVKLDTIDIQQLKTPEAMKAFNIRLDSMKYLYGLDHIPAVIGLTDENEVLGLLQTVFSRESLSTEFNDFY